jgi:hypothetical protein
LAQVPTPDQTKLDGKSIDLPLDIEMTIESGKDIRRAAQGTLLGSEITPVFHGPPKSMVQGN